MSCHAYAAFAMLSILMLLFVFTFFTAECVVSVQLVKGRMQKQ